MPKTQHDQHKYRTDEFDLNLLFSALDSKRALLGLTWSGVSKEIERKYTKVAAATIKGIRDKNAVEGDGCLQMLLWLDRSPESFVPGLTTAHRYKLEAPENGVLRFDLAKVYQLMASKRLEEEITWKELAEQIGGFSAQSLKRFEHGGRTSFPAIMRIALWLDVPVKELTKANPW